MVYEYIEHSDGPWNILPHPCFKSTQKIPLYIQIIGSTLMLLFGIFQLTNVLYKTCIHKYTCILYILASSGGLLFMMFNGSVGCDPITIPFTIY